MSYFFQATILIALFGGEMLLILNLSSARFWVAAWITAIFKLISAAFAYVISAKFIILKAFAFFCSILKVA